MLKRNGPNTRLAPNLFVLTLNSTSFGNQFKGLTQFYLPRLWFLLFSEGITIIHLQRQSFIFLKLL